MACWKITDLYGFIESNGNAQSYTVEGSGIFPDDQSLDVDYLNGFVAPHFFQTPGSVPCGDQLRDDGLRASAARKATTSDMWPHPAMV